MVEPTNFMAECSQCRTTQEPSKRCLSCGENDPLKLNNIKKFTTNFLLKSNFIARDSIGLLVIAVFGSIFGSILFNQPIDDGYFSVTFVIVTIFSISSFYIILNSYRRNKRFKQLAIKASNLITKDIVEFGKLGADEKLVSEKLFKIDWPTYFFNIFSEKNKIYHAEILELIESNYDTYFLQYNRYTDTTNTNMFPWIYNNNGKFEQLRDYLLQEINPRNNSLDAFLDLTIVNNRCSNTSTERALAKFRVSMVQLKAF